MNRTISLVVLAVPLLLAAQIAAASPALEAERRLDARVTLDELRIPIGELLERLTSETGVRLGVDERHAPISGYMLTVVVRDVPAREVLDNLARLYTVPHDRWFWSRRGDRLVLRNSVPAAAGLEIRERLRHEYRVGQQALWREFFSLNPEERAAAAARDPNLRALATNPVRNEGFFSFVESLSEPELYALARGRDVYISSNALTPTQRAAVHREHAGRRGTITMNGMEVEPAIPDRFRLYHQDGTIYVNFGAGVGSHGVLGGIALDAAERERLRGEWLGRGESAEAPDGEMPAEEEREGLKPEDLAVLKMTHHRLVQRLARLGRQNVLFDCPPGVHSATYGAYFRLEGDLAEVLANIQQLALMWKRHDDFLLFRHENWPEKQARPVVPWPVLRDLRATAAENHGFLRPSDWLRLSALPSGQLDTLQAEFPDASLIARHQPVFRLAAQMAERERHLLARPEGAVWRDLSASTRRRLAVLFPEAEARTLRLLLRWEVAPEVAPGVTDEGPRALVFVGPAAHPLRPLPLPIRRRVDLDGPTDVSPLGAATAP
jgi:hypothetical protein